MITVGELTTKLRKYSQEKQGNDLVEIMLQFDGDVAYPFLRGDDNHAMGPGGVERFLVLVPDTKDKKLVLKGRD